MYWVPPHGSSQKHCQCRHWRVKVDTCITLSITTCRFQGTLQHTQDVQIRTTCYLSPVSAHSCTPSALTITKTRWNLLLFCPYAAQSHCNCSFCYTAPFALVAMAVQQCELCSSLPCSWHARSLHAAVHTRGALPGTCEFHHQQHTGAHGSIVEQRHMFSCEVAHAAPRREVPSRLRSGGGRVGVVLRDAKQDLRRLAGQRAQQRHRAQPRLRALHRRPGAAAPCPQTLNSKPISAPTQINPRPGTELEARSHQMRHPAVSTHVPQDAYGEYVNRCMCVWAG